MIKFSRLEVGTFFEFQGERYIKVRDTGYYFGIANSKDLNGNWVLVPVDSSVKLIPVSEDRR